MGIYYFGYMPSFWIRLRCVGPTTPGALLPAVLPAGGGAGALQWPLTKWLMASTADVFTYGAVLQWWTMFAIVTADGAPDSSPRAQPCPQAAAPLASGSPSQLTRGRRRRPFVV